jgi:hypothetical protein
MGHVLAETRLRKRRNMVKVPYSKIASSFKYTHISISHPIDVYRPTNKYRRRGIHAKLSQMPEDQQPSWGWKWFCHKYGILSLGIGPEAWNPEEPDIDPVGAEDQLEWGYPFWSMERLVEWGKIRL